MININPMDIGIMTQQSSSLAMDICKKHEQCEECELAGFEPLLIQTMNMQVYCETGKNKRRK